MFVFRSLTWVANKNRTKNEQFANNTGLCVSFGTNFWDGLICAWCVFCFLRFSLCLPDCVYNGGKAHVLVVVVLVDSSSNRSSTSSSRNGDGGVVVGGGAVVAAAIVVHRKNY